ncbi:MAG: hypothetical protein M3O31_04385 [Acidobacteriota bacterium]|nr:hypothetical protein [Acidobacteriota bacterium]
MNDPKKPSSNISIPSDFHFGQIDSMPTDRNAKGAGAFGLAAVAPAVADPSLGPLAAFTGPFIRKGTCATHHGQEPGAPPKGRIHLRRLSLAQTFPLQSRGGPYIHGSFRETLICRWMLDVICHKELHRPFL